MQSIISHLPQGKYIDFAKQKYRQWEGLCPPTAKTYQVAKGRCGHRPLQKINMNNRKKNRLVDYDYSQPGAYFITVCVKDRRPILSTVVGADDHIGPQVRLTEIGTVVQKFTQSIPGIGHYVIMPNHVHMILHISAKNPLEGPMWSSAPTDANIQSLVRTWKTLISKELGQSIWQRTYYDHIIRSEQEYAEIAEYIIGNPGKWIEDTYFEAMGETVGVCGKLSCNERRNRNGRNLV